ncbi:hypothetical protein BS50DRAFT_207197 [Corynespora cassiicola Philippines]|uniref:Uncharacterized protein n=1 Tax=Corynespora cassiicola Philippines TaxID=1448308 RepID=A0A2T2N4K2_CORCC|nr:hypothetical protein BS50DRAFT_207197 [Corynespora cassiicola Philippines]
MGLRSFTVGAIVASAAVAQAMPQELIPIFPIQNATKTTSHPNPTGQACEAGCSVQYPKLSAMRWVPESQVQYTAKIVVATISTIIITTANSTLGTNIQTVFGFVPSEYDLYRISILDDYTRVIDVPLTSSDSVVFSRITYPTPYVNYYTEYHWTGVVPTHDKASSAVCATATPEPANAPLPGHPEYPQPKTAIVENDDLWGQEHVPLWIPISEEPDKAFFDAAFPSESAFSYCESIPYATPAPTAFQAPKFITESTTVWTSSRSDGVIIIQPSASGWEETTTSDRRHTIQIPHIESTVTGWAPTPAPNNDEAGIEGTSNFASPHVESTATGFDRPTRVVVLVPAPEVTSTTRRVFGQGPDAQQSNSPDLPADERPPSLPDAIVSIINDNPDMFPRPQDPPTLPEVVASIVNHNPQEFPQPPADPVAVQASTPAQTPTPIFTFVPTIIDGQSTAVPAFILPGSPATATIGEVVTLSGQKTTLAAPVTIFSMVPATINGVATSSPVYIISGSITATMGQTVTLHGEPAVLAAPHALFTTFTTAINGVPTTTHGYIISGTMVATIGQTVTIDGTTTVLSEPTFIEDGGSGSAIPTESPEQPRPTDVQGVEGVGATLDMASLYVALVTISVCLLMW